MSTKLADERSRIASLENLGGTTNWAQLNIDSDVLVALEAATDVDLVAYCHELLQRFAAVKQPQDHVALGQLYEVYAEALVLMELQARGAKQGFTVRRTPQAGRQGIKTPDFQCEKDGLAFYVEVKTPDIVGGVFAADQMANDILEGRADLDHRKKPGVTVGDPVELRPHGDLPNHGAALIDAMIYRICNAIKKEQVTYGPTILLVFTGRLPFDVYAPCCLVPAYFHPFPPPKPETQGFPGECESGLWWHIGYGMPGDLILGKSEFEGSGNLTGRIKNHGVLVQHPYLIGLAVMSKPWSNTGYHVHSLLQSDRRHLSSDERFDSCDPAQVVPLISDGWNDQSNCNGIRYQVRG